MAGIIFDLDGTLVDSIGDIGTAANRVLDRRGWPEHSKADYSTMIGNGIRELLRRAIPEQELDALDTVVAEFRADYWDHLVVETAPFEGIAPLLEELRSRGHRLAVLSNKPHRFTERIGKLIFTEAGFAAFWGHRDGYERKPAPTSALELQGILGTEASDTWFVGDSPVDCKTAIAAGMHPVGVAWGYQSVADLNAAGAEIVLQTPAELLAHLE